MTNQLVSRIATGDQQAFRQLFESLEGALIYFANQFTSQQQQAEDTVLVAFQKLWERREGFTTLPAVRSFLYTTVRNQSLNNLKRNEKTNEIHQALQQSIPQTDDYIEYRMLQAELLRLIYNEMQSLPEKYRQILIYTYLDELPTAEIAARLNMEESSIRAARTRAMAQLKKTLAEKQLLEIATALFLLWRQSAAV